MFNKKIYILAALFLILTIFIQGCSSAPAGKAKPNGQGSSSDGLKTLIEEAQKDKELVVLTYLGGDALQAIQNEWRKAGFGIDLKINTMQGEEIIEKVTTERNAGLYSLDLAIFGLGTLFTLKSKGYLDKIDDTVLKLDEVKNPSLWWGKTFPYVDPEQKIINITLTPQAPIHINPGVIPKNEIKSYYDLLKPGYQNKILINDPRKTGSSLTWFAAMLESKALDKKYFTDLARQAGALSVDQMQQAQWVAQGKYPIGLGLDNSRIRQVEDAGAEFHGIVPKEGTLLTPGAGNLALLNRAPHSNAVKLFINWYLTKDMQAVMSKALNAHTRRTDVKVDGILKEVSIRKEGTEYFNTGTQEFTQKMLSYQKVAEEVFRK